MPPPPSRPRYNQNNDIHTNEIANDNINGIANDAKYPTKVNNNNNNDGFFVDIPPKFFKTASPAKQQYYQQQYLNEILNRNFYNHANGKYNIIAFKNTYHNVPYYVVSVSNYKLIILYSSSSNNGKQSHQSMKSDELSNGECVRIEKCKRFSISTNPLCV